MTIASTGIVTFADDIIIKDAGTIGSATTPSTITIDSNGRVLVGTSNNPSIKDTVTPSLVVNGSGVDGSMQVSRHTSVGGGGAVLELTATRGSDVNSYTILQSDDGVGSVIFSGADGTEFVNAATITASVDGTPGDDDMPGRLTFSTTADGASSVTERMRIDSSGNVGINDSSPSYRLDVGGDINYTGTLYQNGVAFASGAPRGYLSGMGLSNDTDTDHDILVAVGIVRDAADAVDIELTSAITKQIDASWASGDDAGGLSSSLTLSADTWYHVHAIIVSGSADIGFDTSVTAANLVTDHSATAYRRIGSVLTDSSSNIINFQQFGDEFIYDSQVNNLSSGSPGTTRLTQTVTAPLGVETRAILGIIAVVAGSNSGVRFTITHPGVTDAAAATANLNNGGENSSNNNGTWASGTHIVRTNTSSQVAYRQDFGASVSINTNGYYDDRGQY
jgi:hypothetical protein